MWYFMVMPAKFLLILCLSLLLLKCQWTVPNSMKGKSIIVIAGCVVGWVNCNRVFVADCKDRLYQYFASFSHYLYFQVQKTACGLLAEQCARCGGSRMGHFRFCAVQMFGFSRLLSKVIWKMFQLRYFRLQREMMEEVEEYNASLSYHAYRWNVRGWGRGDSAFRSSVCPCVCLYLCMSADFVRLLVTLDLHKILCSYLVDIFWDVTLWDDIDVDHIVILTLILDDPTLGMVFHGHIFISFWLFFSLLTVLLLYARL